MNLPFDPQQRRIVAGEERDAQPEMINRSVLDVAHSVFPAPHNQNMCQTNSKAQVQFFMDSEIFMTDRRYQKCQYNSNCRLGEKCPYIHDTK